jgi:hypothetical protein
LVSQTSFKFGADLVEGNFEGAGWKEGQMAAGFTTRLGFLAKTFDKPREGFWHIRHKGEGINAGSLPTGNIHCF